MNALLIVLLGVLQVVDGVVTYLGLSFAEVDEVNPVLNYFAKWLGLGKTITIIKLMGLAFIAFLFIDRRKMKSLWITSTLASSVSFYSWVVGNNVFLVAGSIAL